MPATYRRRVWGSARRYGKRRKHYAGGQLPITPFPGSSLTSEKKAASRRLWDAIEKRVDKRARNIGSRHQLHGKIDDFMEMYMDKAYRVLDTGYQALFLPGGDMVASAMADILDLMGDMLENVYGEILVLHWEQAMGNFNHGQIAMTENYVWDQIDSHLANVENVWPEAEPDWYVYGVASAFDWDVWGRALSDVTYEPVPQMNEAASHAMECYDMAAELGFYSDALGYAQDLFAGGGFSGPPKSAKIRGGNSRILSGNISVNRF